MCGDAHDTRHATARSARENVSEMCARGEVERDRALDVLELAGGVEDRVEHFDLWVAHAVR